MQGEGTKIKPIRYGPFKILDKIGTNDFWLELPPYMEIYSVVNVEKLRLYEPPIIEDQGENVHIPTIEYFSPEYMNELQEDTILEKRVCTSPRGDVEYLRVGLKGTNPSQFKWMETEKLRKQYPHLFTK
jgi:hypothetical protein